MNDELEQERNERKQDKKDTYSDFEQVCRNIDDRVKGENEKLWEKVRADNDDFQKQLEQYDADKENIELRIKQEQQKREDENNRK